MGKKRMCNVDKIFLFILYWIQGFRKLRGYILSFFSGVYWLEEKKRRRDELKETQLSFLYEIIVFEPMKKENEF
jgi:uncharacterized membrane protein YbhN (UPF0104 family)